MDSEEEDGGYASVDESQYDSEDGFIDDTELVCFHEHPFSVHVHELVCCSVAMSYRRLYTAQCFCMEVPLDTI